MFGSGLASVACGHRDSLKLPRWLLPALLSLILCVALSTSASAQTLERWIYVSSNLLVPEQVERLEKLMREAAPLGYTHVLLADSKFSRLHELDDRYFRNVLRLRETAAQLGLRLVPAVFPV